jgi:activator-of-BECN1-regulated-autophagy protein 1
LRCAQVRFHPRNSALLASGSLDFEVRVWDAARAVCIASCEYGASPSAQRTLRLSPPHSQPPHAPRRALPGRPIASLAFYPDGDLLAVASGHKARAAPLSRLV